MIMFWNVSTISAYGAAAALQDQEGLRNKTSLCSEGRDYLERELAKIEALAVYHSEANYILVDATAFGESSKEIVDGVLQKHGIILRPVKPFRDKTGMVRITIGRRDENERLVAALTDYFATR
jgi:histidinol-phosphate/aromatic aminotransferase/cobyric acid decarboxylase-like protein